MVKVKVKEKSTVSVKNVDIGAARALRKILGENSENFYRARGVSKKDYDGIYRFFIALSDAVGREYPG